MRAFNVNFKQSEAEHMPKNMLESQTWQRVIRGFDHEINDESFTAERDFNKGLDKAWSSSLARARLIWALGEQFFLEKITRNLFSFLKVGAEISPLTTEESFC